MREEGKEEQHITNGEGEIKEPINDGKGKGGMSQKLMINNGLEWKAINNGRGKRGKAKRKKWRQV